jgi:hypothetical protein
VTEGQTGTFTVAATAPASLTYQWQRAAPNSATFTDIAGATASAYTTPATLLSDDGSRYRAKVCTRGGTPPADTCVFSNPATLSVAAAAVAPTFTQQPQSISVQSGQTASFTAVASGTPAPSIQWYQVGSPNQAVGSPCAPGTGNSTSCTYTTAPVSLSDSGAQFFARASNSAGSIDSNTVTLTVTGSATAPSITTQPADQTVTVGANATFTVAAIGTAPLSYQWQRNGADIAGANAASYTLTNVQLADNGALFRVVVSNSAGSVTSNAATLTVNPAPSGACGLPQRIDSDTGSGAGPRVLLDSSGNATAVWLDRYTVFANRYDAGSGWGTKQAIGNTPAIARDALIGQDGAGNLLAVWGDGYGVYANYYTVGSGWGNGVDLSYGTGSNNASSAPALAMAASGQGMVVWQHYDGTNNRIYARRYTGNGWGQPQVISSSSSSNEDDTAPDVAVDAYGRAIAVWVHSGFGKRAYYNVFDGTGWGTPQAIPMSTNVPAVDVVRVAMNGTGQAVAIWRRYDGGPNGVYAAIYTPGSGWSTPTTLDPGSTERVDPFVAIDASGNAIAVWNQYDGYRHLIYSRRYTPGSGWSPIEQLQAPASGETWQPSIAMDPSGSAFVTWVQFQSATYRVFGRRYAPSSGWGSPVPLGEATVEVHTPRVALNASSTAMVVWSEGSNGGAIKAVRCQ